MAVVLEYLPAGTLKDRIGQDGRRAPLAPAAVMLLAEELLSALTALHAAGVVHRDLKPANVLFRSTGQAVLADLGVARIPDSEITRLTAAGQLIGTLAYLPPESFKDPVVGITGDLFALGVTLHEALTGLHPTGFRPFPSMFEPRDPALALPDCPASLGRLIVDRTWAGGVRDLRAAARRAGTDTALRRAWTLPLAREEHMPVARAARKSLTARSYVLSRVHCPGAVFIANLDLLAADGQLQPAWDGLLLLDRALGGARYVGPVSPQRLRVLDQGSSIQAWQFAAPDHQVEVLMVDRQAARAVHSTPGCGASHAGFPGRASARAAAPRGRSVGGPDGRRRAPGHRGTGARTLNRRNHGVPVSTAVSILLRTASRVG